MKDEHDRGGPPSGSTRVLLVEDDDGDALLLQRLLSGQRHGSFDIRGAGSLSAALQAAAQGGIDVVLLDLGLPDSRGLDTFLRLHEAAARAPILVLSGLDDEALATAAVQRGAQDYIVKGREDGASLARAIRYAIERCRAQQALAEEHDLLRSLIDNIPDQVYLKNTSSRFVSVNPATAAFFGVASPDSIIGTSDFDYFPRELAEQFQAEEQALLRRDRPCVNREAAITDSAGATRWMLTTKVPLRDPAGNITGLLGINRDITARKKAENALRRLNDELEQRVAERTSELQKAMARLVEHDRKRAEFVSSVSHELRTPLTSMKFEIANLLEGVVGPVPEPVIKYLHRMETDCRRMADTVEDILDLSRLESKTMRVHRAKHRFDAIVRQGASALNAQAQTKNIEIALAVGRGLGFVECDSHKMMRAIINLVGNAIKFTPNGGRVDIGLRREAAVPDALVVEITDNGIGIAPQHLERVTEKYYRVGEDVSGTGLGLSISKEIVELHGGQLAVQSPPPGRDRGTRVSVSLPAVEPPAILIAHGDRPTRDLIEDQLRAYGYRVIPCSSGDDALDVARRLKPDLGILQVSSPDRGEANLVLLVRADANLRTMSIVAMASGPVAPGTREILSGLGIPIVAEPWREEDLADRVEAAIKGPAASNGPAA